MSLDIHYWL